MQIDLSSVMNDLPDEITEKELMATWADLARTLELDHGTGLEVLLTAARDSVLNSTGDLDPAWGGGWRWDLREATVRTLATAIVLGGVLASCHQTDLPPLVLPTLIPLLFDLKRVRLERGADRTLRIIGARKDLVDRLGTPSQLYESLPAEVRQAVGAKDFEGYLREAVQAGRAEEHEDFVQVLPNGETVLTVAID